MIYIKTNKTDSTLKISVIFTQVNISRLEVCNLILFQYNYTFVKVQILKTKLKRKRYTDTRLASPPFKYKTFQYAPFHNFHVFIYLINDINHTWNIKVQLKQI